ncbi:hypothetical protein HDK64DRAFT_316030 [Phyllosticta capitalensis]
MLWALACSTGSTGQTLSFLVRTALTQRPRSIIPTFNSSHPFSSHRHRFIPKPSHCLSNSQADGQYANIKKANRTAGKMMCIGADVSHPARRVGEGGRHRWFLRRLCKLHLSVLIVPSGLSTCFDLVANINTRASLWHVAVLGVGFRHIISGTTSSSSLLSVKSKIPVALPSLSSVRARASLAAAAAMRIKSCPGEVSLCLLLLVLVHLRFRNSRLLQLRTTSSIPSPQQSSISIDRQRQPSAAKPVNPTWISRTPVEDGWLTRYFCLPSATGVDRGAPAEDGGRPGVHWIHHRRNGNSALDDWVGGVEAGGCPDLVFGHGSSARLAVDHGAVENRGLRKRIVAGLAYIFGGGVPVAAGVIWENWFGTFTTTP